MPQLKIGSTLNFSNVDELLKNDVVNRASDAVLLDLSATQHVDSAGVALILRWFRVCQSKGVEFTLQGVSEQLQTLLDAYDLEKAFSR